MSWHLVDGVPLPDPVAGHPALDFCNTRAGWPSAEAGGPAKEYLTSPRALELWARDSGLLTLTAPSSGAPGPSGVPGPSGAPGPPGAPDAAAAALARALALRDALYRSLLGRGAPADWALVSAEVVAGRDAMTLGPGDGGRARWQLCEPVEGPGLPPALAALHLVAGAAEEVLLSPSAACVAACPGDGCGWLFADPRRRRRWCSMAVCGNRAKARRHAAAARRTPRES